MSIRDSYHAYTEGNVFSGSPLEMVIALYEGTIEAIRQARHCLAIEDVWGRSRAINKGVKLLTELLVSLEHQEGNEISGNLKALYSYVQSRLLEAHSTKSAKPLDEAERLLSTILEGWREASEKEKAEAHASRSGTADSMWDCTRDTLRETGTCSVPDDWNGSNDTSNNHAWGYGFFVDTPELAGVVSAVF